MKTLLVDDHPLILSALSQVIAGLEGGCEVVTAGSAQQARDALARDPGFDLVLLDLQLGDADGFALLAEFRQAHPALPVVVVSASERHADVMRAVDLGAMGFVPKRASQHLLLEALRLVMSGGVYVPPPALRQGGPAASAAPPAVAPDPLPSPDLLGLTPRQAEVLALLMKGQSNKLIARELRLSVDTVKDHMSAVIRALGVSTRMQAVLAVKDMAREPRSALGWKPPAR